VVNGTTAADLETAAPAGTRIGSERGGVQSVDRALTLLDELTRAGGSLPLSELSSRVGLNISTCHHLLATLVKWGYVARLPGRRGYALGARVLHLGQAFMRQIDLPRRAQPHLDRINEATGETVHLAVLQSDSVVTLSKREARHAVRAETGAPGTEEAAHASATGKAMLAWLPDNEINRILKLHGMPRFTPATLTDQQLLIEELRHVRRNGYAMDREEFQPGVTCIGAVIRNHTGAVVGAISASTPSLRADEAHLALMRQEVLAAARALSAEFGQTGEPASETETA
jgi:IclR family acetate operon transcriptional repressor